MDSQDIYNLIKNNKHNAILFKDGIIEFKDFKYKNYNKYIIINDNKTDFIVKQDDFKIEFYYSYNYKPNGSKCFTTDKKRTGYLFEFNEMIKYLDYNVRAILLVDTNDFSIDKYINKDGNILERPSINKICEIFYIFID